MALTNEQEKQIKEQLLKQLDKVPEASRKEVEQQIKSMSKEQLEEFIKKNQGGGGEQPQDMPSCIFCAIVEGKSPAIKVGENDDAVAVLDINPISRGHTLVIPKKHDTEPTEETQKLAFEVGGKILEKLSPKDITTRGAKVGDHTILNVIPIYDDTDFEKRNQVEGEELIKIASEITGVEVKIEQPKPVENKEEKPEPPKEPVCIFCAIASKEMESYVIDENKDNLAILEINPISKGHALVVPKKHLEVEEIPTNTFSLSKKILLVSKRLYPGCCSSSKVSVLVSAAEILYLASE